MIQNLIATIWVILLVVLIWPAYSRAADAFDATKKKSGATSFLQPLKSIHRKFAPRSRSALHATRRWLFAAFVIDWICWGVAKFHPALQQSLAWQVVAMGLVCTAVGRAIMFWVSDRSIKPETPNTDAAA